MNFGVKIIACTCKNKQQDEMYGPKMRVHNATGQKRQAAGTLWRCTVCKHEKS